MRSRRHRPRIADCVLLGLVGCTLATASTASANPPVIIPPFEYGVNLIQNPNANEGPFQDVDEGDPPVEIQDWADDGPMTVLAFCNAATPEGSRTPCFERGDPHLSDSLPAFRLFAGGVATASHSSLSQSLASPPAVDTDSGRVVYELSGWLGGVGDDDDSMTVRLTFLDGAGSAITQATLGPVLATDRRSLSIVMFRKAFGHVPVGTRGMSIEIVADHTSSSFIDAYGSLFSLSLSRLDDQEHWLTASDAKPIEQFGRALSVTPETIVVGRPEYLRTNQYGQVVARDPYGAAYVFGRNPSAASHADVWPEVARLESFRSGDGFAGSVAVDGDTVAVSAPTDDELPTAGAVHLFERDFGGAGNWGLARKLRPAIPAAFAHVGRSLAISGDLLAVGMPGDHVDVNQDPNQPPSYVDGMGSVRLFRRDAGGPQQWGEVRKIAAGASSARFGFAVALDGDTLAVGLPGWIRFCCPQINAMGQVHVFERNEGGPDNWGRVAVIWSPTWDLEPANFAHGGEFGDLLALEGDTLIVGGPRTLTDSTFVVYDRNRPGESPGETRDVWGRVQVVVVGRIPTKFSDRIPIALEGDRVVATLDDGLHVFDRDEGGPDQWGEVAVVDLPEPPSGVGLAGSVLALSYPDDDLAGTDAGLVVVDESIFVPAPAAGTSALVVLLALAWAAQRRRVAGVGRGGALLP